MPPFASLSEQERWDVVSYALTLHTKPDQIAQGKTLLETNCADCAKTFNNQEMMSALSENDLIQIMKEGKGKIPAFGKSFTDEEASAVAAYIRTLTFAPPPAPVAVSASATPVSTLAGTPSAETTPVDGTQAAVTPEAGTQIAVTPSDGTQVAATAAATTPGAVGKVSGSVNNKTGNPIPTGSKVTLRAMEHGSDPSAGLKDIAKIEGTLNTDGTFVFENVEIPEKRIFTADVDVDGLVYQSDFVVVKAGDTAVVIPPIVMFVNTTDFSILKILSLQIYFDTAVEGSTQIFSVYTISNSTEKTVNVKMASAQEIPFIAFPDGAEALGFEATQDTAIFMQTADGFAMPPSTTSYGLIAYASVPKGEKINFSQAALLPIDKVALFLPEGMEAQGDTLKDEGIQKQNNTNFHVYSSSSLKKDENIKFTVTGKPQTVAVNPNPLQNKMLLIGVGALGLVLVLAGAWLFLRGPKPVLEEADQEENNFEDPESLMDAIIALDDLHRAGKLSDEAYQKRRDELKSELKKKS
jgi:hypothetical protein